MSLTNYKYICEECGTKYSSPESTPPPGIKWSDEHECNPVPRDEKSSIFEKLNNEKETGGF
jgi:hypothetical protein